MDFAIQAIPSWLNSAAMRQDYAWFLVAAGWVVLLMLAWRAGLPGALGVGFALIAQALSEIVSMLVVADSTGRPEAGPELWLGLLALFPPLAILFAGTRQRFGRGWAMALATVVAGASVALALARYKLAGGTTTMTPAASIAPRVIGLTAVLNGLTLGAGAWGTWLMQTALPADRRRQRWLVAALLVSMGPLFASSGVFAELLGWPRRWLTASPVGLLSVSWQVLCLGVAFSAWGRLQKTSSGERISLRSLRWGVAVVGAWLIFGAVLVELAGRVAYSSFLESIRARARTGLSVLDPTEMARCLGPAFKLENVRPGKMAAWKALIADAPVTLSANFTPLQQRLKQFLGVNPDFSYAYVKTLRQGWVVGGLMPYNAKRRDGVINIDREIGAFDLEHWAEKTGYVHGPAWSPRGTNLEVAEPATGPDGAMLGWFTVVVSSNYALAAQAPARVLTCLTIAMGSVIAGGFIVLRARKGAQREAREQAAAALAADRMKSALLAHVSHELRTPLQGILGYAELLAGRPLDETQRGWLSSQRRQGELLLRLVNDLIDLSALQNGVFAFASKPAQLAPLIEETVLSLRPRAHVRHLRLDLDLDAALPTWLVFDADRVRQVILNLVGNAIKFTDVGHVGVHVRVLSHDGAQAVVEIAVADTGPGIAPEEQARLFQPFTRLDRTSHLEGTGLGLALARGLCLGMKGLLTVESDGQSGTTFRARVALPIGGAAETRNETMQPSRAHSGLRIFVAEDNTLVRELYLAHLSSQGAECSHAVDGVAAVEMVRSQQPPPEVLLLDLAMPRLDGIEVARQLRTLGPAGLRIIGVSAHGNPAYRQRALAAGMDEFLIKPVKLSELSRCVQQLVGRETTSPHSNLPEALKEKLQQVFEEEFPKVLGELARALQDKNWEVVEARAHYLKNSAWALGDAWLAERCESICDAAQTGNESVARLALTEIQMRPPGGA